MRTFILAVCLSYFILSLRADALRDRMDAYVRRYADSDFFSGVVRVTKGDRIIYENAFGYADRGWPAVPVRLGAEADDCGGNFVIGGGEEA